MIKCCDCPAGFIEEGDFCGSNCEKIEGWLEEYRNKILDELSFSVHKDSTAMLVKNHYEYAIGIYEFDEKVKQMKEEKHV